MSFRKYFTKMGTSLETSPTNGRILNNKKAMKMWGREYEKRLGNEGLIHLSNLVELFIC